MTPQEKLQQLQEMRDPSLKMARILKEHSVAEAVLKMGQLQGIKGEQGEQGVKGDQGDRGEQGIQGEEGKQGIQGLRGGQGPMGERGDRGEQGIPGTSGRDGNSPDISDVVKEIQKTPVHLKDIQGTEKLIEFLKSGGFRGGGGLSNITGLIQQGTNVTITGTGTFGDPYIINSSGGGGGSPAAPDTSVQFNDSGSFGGTHFFTYNKTTGNFTVGDETGAAVGLLLDNVTSQYSIGDTNGIRNETYINIDDANFITGFYGLKGVHSDVPYNTAFPSGTPGYTGSGVNDMEWNGYWNDSTALPISLTVTMDTVGNGTLSYSGLSGTFMPGDVITQSSGSGVDSTAEVVSDDGSTITFTNYVPSGTGFGVGEGIDGAPSGANATIDSFDLNDDTFNWSDSNGNSDTGLSVDTANITLENNINVFFGGTRGHSLDDSWNWNLDVTKGGNQMLFNGNSDTGPSWTIGDIDNVIKGQTFGMSSTSGDANDWKYEVKDNRGRFLLIHPVDAPSIGQFAFGDMDQTNNGSFLNIDDRRQVIDLFSGSSITTPNGRHSMLRAEWSNRFKITIGDADGTLNGSQISVDDLDRQIHAHVSIDPDNTVDNNAVDAFDDIGALSIPNLTTTAYGSFKSVTDQTTGGQGFFGVGGDAATNPSIGNDAVFAGHIDALGSSATLTMFDLAGEPATILSNVNATTGFNMKFQLNSHQFNILGNNSGISLKLDDTTGLIHFNNNYTFPFAAGTTGQVLELDASNNLQWVSASGLSLETDGTPNGDQTLLNLVAGTNVTLTDDGSGNVTIDSTGGSTSPGGSAGDVQFNDGSGGFAGIGASHSTRIIIDDSLSQISLQTGAFGTSGRALYTDTSGVPLARFDFQNRLVQIGDTMGSGSSTFFELNDAAGLLYFNSGGSTYFKLDAPNQKYQMGDILGAGNGTYLDIEDNAHKVAIISGGSAYLSLDKGNNLYQIGDVSGGLNDTRISINDTAQTIELNGGLVQSDQYATPATGATVVIAQNTTVLTVNPSGTLLALTIQFPSSPPDGRTVSFNCTQAVTGLTLSGGTFVGGLTSLTAGAGATFVYSSGDSKWHYQP